MECKLRWAWTTSALASWEELERLNITILLAKSALVIWDSSGADSMRLISTRSVGASSSSIFILIMIMVEGGRNEASFPDSGAGDRKPLTT